MKSLRRIWSIAKLTATEGLRQPAFFFLFLASATLIGLSPSFAFFHLSEEAKMVTDLGLSTILTLSTLLTILNASSSITDEIEGRTALVMLSKPLRREEFLFGKYLGIVITGCAFVLLNTPVFLTTLRSQQYPEEVLDPAFGSGVKYSLAFGMTIFGVAMVLRLLLRKNISLVRAFWLAYTIASAFLFIYLSSGPAEWEWRMLSGLFFICLHVCVITAFAVALATRLTLVQTAIGTAAFFIIGHAAGALVAPFRDSEQHLSAFGRFLRAVLPDLDQFNITDALANSYIDKPIPIPAEVIGQSTLYALLYGLALMAIALAMFSRRELS